MRPLVTLALAAALAACSHARGATPAATSTSPSPPATMAQPSRSPAWTEVAHDRQTEDQKAVGASVHRLP